MRPGLHHLGAPAKSRGALVLLTILSLGPLSAAAQTEANTRIIDVRREPARFAGGEVAIEGEVVQYRTEARDSLTFFFLLGDYGGLIAVGTESRRPPIGQRRQVRGVVSLDPRNIPYVTETSSSALTEADAPPTTTDRASTESRPSESREDPLLIYVLLASLVSVLFLFAGVVVFLIRSSRGDAASVTAGSDVPVARPTFGLRAESDSSPDSVAEVARTIRVLPGRFSVMAGLDRLTDVRFFRRPDAATDEITFGRNPGPPYSHVTLESPTVSRTHAKLLFANQRYTLFNFSGTNPTTVNGRSLGVHESVVLEDGDRIEMGEVQFRFHDA